MYFSSPTAHSADILFFFLEESHTFLLFHIALSALALLKKKDKKKKKEKAQGTSNFTFYLVFSLALHLWTDQ